MKPVDQWENTFLRRLTVLIALPVVIVMIIVLGAWKLAVGVVKEIISTLRIEWEEIVEEVRGMGEAMRGAWKGKVQ